VAHLDWLVIELRRGSLGLSPTADPSTASPARTTLGSIGPWGATPARQHEGLYQLAERVIEWDERVNVRRYQSSRSGAAWARNAQSNSSGRRRRTREAATVRAESLAFPWAAQAL
jgi:hypothetical protein